MDSLQGIPVEYELDTFNTPPQEQLYVTPKIGYVNAMLLFHFDTELSIHLWRQRTPSPQFTRHTKTGDSKVQYLQRQHGFR